MKKPQQTPAATPAQEPAVEPVAKQTRKKVGKKPSSEAVTTQAAGIHPILARYAAENVQNQQDATRKGISYVPFKRGISFYVNGVYTLTRPFADVNEPAFMEFADPAERDWLGWAKYFEAGLAQIAATPESLHGDAARMAVLATYFNAARSLHLSLYEDTEANMSGLNRLFGGVTDEQPVGNYADYRRWKPVAAPVYKKAGQELTLTATEATVFRTLTVRFGYRVPMPDGQEDGMVCYATENQGTLKIKAGDRIFAAWNAA